MGFKEFIVIVSCLLALAASQGDEDTCKCSSSVIVMSKDELALEIQSQVAIALARGIKTLSSNLNISGIVTNIVRDSSEDLFARIEIIAAKIAPLVTAGCENLTLTVHREMKRLAQPIAMELANLLKPGRSPSHPASSCKAILKQNEASVSDYYWMRALNGTAVRMFCDMTKNCGGVTGGWMKIAELDKTKISSQCPEPLTQITHQGKKLCGRRQTAAGCSGVNYQTHGIGYNEVCGRVIGYQWGSTDGPNRAVSVENSNIDDAYIDGVSLTHGRPRSHIWSFIAAQDETGIQTASTCYCTNRNSRGQPPPSYVGNDYFCDTGSEHRYGPQLYPDDPLWDGAGCGPVNDCCTLHNPPWFYKKLGYSTGDSVEMRVCRDEVVINEDVLLEKVDLYVR